MRKVSFKNGFVTLMSIIVIGAVGATITTGIVLMSIRYSQTSDSLFMSNKAKFYASACAEKGLMNFRKNIDYYGNDTLDFADGECFIYPLVLSEGRVTIKAEGTYEGYIGRVQIDVVEIELGLWRSEWKEVEEFTV